MITDTDNIKAIQSGQTEQFGVLYDKYIAKIYNFVYYKTQHKETAEDLVSQTFLKALNNLEKFKPGKGTYCRTYHGTYQAWLFRIARNTVIDHYRTKKKDLNIEDAFDLAGDEDIPRDLDTKNKLAEVEKYLKDLKPEQRDIIIMRVWQEMSYAEIAEITGKSEASCKMKYCRAINKLRNEMPISIFIFLLWHLG